LNNTGPYIALIYLHIFAFSVLYMKVYNHTMMVQTIHWTQIIVHSRLVDDTVKGELLTIFFTLNVSVVHNETKYKYKQSGSQARIYKCCSSKFMNIGTVYINTYDLVFLNAFSPSSIFNSNGLKENFYILYCSLCFLNIRVFNCIFSNICYISIQYAAKMHVHF